MNPPTTTQRRLPGPCSTGSSLAGISPIAFRVGTLRWKVRSAGLATEIADLLRNPDAHLKNKDQLFHDTMLVTMGRVAWPALKGSRWLLRRTNYGKPLATLRDCFRVSGPMRAFQNGLAFEQADVPVPRILAAGIVRVLQKPVVGYLLLEEIPAALTLLEYLNQHGQIPAVAVRKVAKAVAEMHERGFVHGDLTLRNVLLDERLDPWLIDLERAERRSDPVNWRDTAEDFFRFARYVIALGPRAHGASLRLVIHYCRLRGWAGREREFANAVLARLRQKVKASALQ